MHFRRGHVLQLVLACALALLAACSAETVDSAAGAKPESKLPQDKKLAYGVGFYLGEEVRTGLESDGIKADMALLIQGFTDGVYNRVPVEDRAELDALLVAVHEEMKVRTVNRLLREDPDFKKLHDDNLVASNAYHERRKSEPGVTTLDDGVQYRVLAAGSGRKPVLADTVVLNFTVTNLKGEQVMLGEESVLTVESVIPAAGRVLQLMPVGSRWEVAFPPSAAFGPAGEPPRIGPNETIIIDVELVAIR
jgi:FKBP-type peptidyl-prolyl cis-trans isomerase FklB